MTTKVTVEANHGWPVEVTGKSPKTGVETMAPQIVQPNEKRDFFIHGDLDLHVHEVQPDEVMDPPADADPTPRDDG